MLRRRITQVNRPWGSQLGRLKKTSQKGQVEDGREGGHVKESGKEEGRMKERKA